MARLQLCNKCGRPCHGKTCLGCIRAGMSHYSLNNFYRNKRKKEAQNEVPPL